MRILMFLAAMLMPSTLCSAMNTPGKWQLLFGGKSTDSWRGYRQQDFPNGSWAIEGGTLRAIPGSGRTDIVTKEIYGDFELELQWRTSHDGNSGVFYRATEDNEAIWQSAPEMQVLDDQKYNDGKNPKTSAGALYALIAPGKKQLRPVGQWNSVRLIVRGTHVQHWLNGRKIVDCDLAGAEVSGLIAESKFASFPGFAKALAGHVGLQNHGQEVWFRNVRIRRLD